MESRASTFWVDIPDFENFEYLTYEQLDVATQQILETDAKRGDLVAVKSATPDRNNGLLIFDGEKVVELPDELDQYDHLPNWCKVIENNVPLKYWHDKSSFSAEDEKKHLEYLEGKCPFTPYYRAVEHNFIVWYDTSRLDGNLSEKLEYKPLPWNSNVSTIWAKMNSEDGPIFFVYDYWDMAEHLAPDEIVYETDRLGAKFAQQKVHAFSCMSSGIEGCEDTDRKILYINEI